MLYFIITVPCLFSFAFGYSLNEIRNLHKKINNPSVKQAICPIVSPITGTSIAYNFKGETPKGQIIKKSDDNIDEVLKNE